MQEHNEKSNIALRVTAVFLLLMTLTIYFMPNGLYAKYRASAQGNDSARVAAFAPQLVIDNNTNLSFANVNKDLGVPLDVSFTVQNYTKNVVTEVALKYSLVFYIPEDTFAKTAMFQLMKEDGKTPLTPMYNIKDLVAGTEHTTEGNNSYGYAPTVIDESLVPESDESGVFNLTKLNDTNDSAGTITVETVSESTTSYLLFGLWRETTRGTILLDPTLKLTQGTEEKQFLKITISRPEFVLQGGVEDYDKMRLRVFCSDGMTEGEKPIDTALHTKWGDLEGKVSSENLSIIDIDTTKSYWKPIYNKETRTLNIEVYSVDENGERTHIETYSDIKVGHPSAEYDESNSNSVAETYVSCGKGYPCRLNVLFEQIPPSSGS